MESYPDWYNNQNYKNHVSRLNHIMTKKTVLNPETPKKKSKSVRIRCKTEPHQSQKDFLPVPLVSGAERKLLSGAITSNHLKLREKETLLENYVLGKRILETSSVFSSAKLKREFKFHKKVSQNMSKSIQKQGALITSRDKRFQGYQNQLHKGREILGVGKFIVSLRILSIYLIKTRLEQNSDVLYRLKYTAKDKYKQQGETYSQFLASQHLIRFKYRNIINDNGLRLSIECLKKNQPINIGDFVVDCSVKLKNQLDAMDSSRPLRKQRVIENVYNSKNEVVGTIQYQLDQYFK